MPHPSTTLTGSHVVLTCGLAGSGRTAFSLQLEKQGYTRLSIDDALWDVLESGQPIDPADAARIARDVGLAVRERLLDLIQAGENVVVDYAFADKPSRIAYRVLAERYGAIVDLVYFRLPTAETEHQLMTGDRPVDGVEKGSTDAYIDHFDAPGDDEQPIVINAETEPH